MEAVKFYDYRAFLPGNEVTKVLYEASFEACTHRGELLVSELLRFTADSVQLSLTPREGMTWWAWANALWGMRMMVKDHEMYFEWDFTVVNRRAGEIGYGKLVGTTRASTATSKR